MSGAAKAASDAWPDELGPMIRQIRREHPLLWAKTQTGFHCRALIGRWLPRLCKHVCTGGPVNGPMTCLDCGVEVPDA